VSNGLCLLQNRCIVTAADLAVAGSGGALGAVREGNMSARVTSRPALRMVISAESRFETSSCLCSTWTIAMCSAPRPTSVCSHLSSPEFDFVSQLPEFDFASQLPEFDFELLLPDFDLELLLPDFDLELLLPDFDFAILLPEFDIENTSTRIRRRNTAARIRRRNL